ncbi:bile acid:sodium symporter family protein [Calycomorphotria hydatis]|uniref:Sodium Bile acid symporter family protein n=1 Tax=Calycomorphotria hydatis TaxID=2528027 RepID=A0A517TC30_9PLAN|nr:bile acid:sodium symporter family protein [Calycomorphotria hydatis]QDT65921.1 Sodium Bile acid symporter family protein [Calycomorphotria hydatis]
MQQLLFSIFIVASAILGFFFPEFCLHPFGINSKPAIVPLLQVTMFGMGAVMSWRDFAAVVKQPWGVVIGIVCQFTIMPLLGWALAGMAGLPPEIAAGLILVGCSPSGLSSNVICYVARANVPLSITLTSVATMIGPFVTPFWMKLLADSYVEVEPFEMMWKMSQIVLFPIAGGLVINAIFHKQSQRLHYVLPYLSMFCIGLIVAIITAAGKKSIISGGFYLAGVVIIHNVCGYILGYYAARLCLLKEQDRRTVAVEVGMQNAGLATGIAIEMGKDATMGAAPVLFATLMNVTAPVMAAIWARKKPVQKINS